MPGHLWCWVLAFLRKGGDGASGQVASVHPGAGRGHRRATHFSRTYLGVNHFTLYAPWCLGPISHHSVVVTERMGMNKAGGASALLCHLQGPLGLQQVIPGGQEIGVQMSSWCHD